MTHEEAGLLLKEIFENSFPKGLVGNVPKLYSRDIVGHFQDKEFYYEDIEKRYALNKEHVNKFSFQVLSWMVFDEFIFAMVKEHWKNDKTQQHYEAIVSLVYRIKGGKICEVWFMIDNDSEESYQHTNENFLLVMQKASVNEKNKQIFFKRLEAIEKLWPEKKVILTVREKECLYYYLSGFSAKEIAAKMDLSVRTIEDYLAVVKEKYQCTTKAALRKKIFNSE